MRFFQKLDSAIKEFGTANAFIYLLHRVLERVGGALHVYHFVAQAVPPAPLLRRSRGGSIAIRMVSADDPVLLQMPLEREVIDYRARQGAICFGAFQQDAMIGCIWLCLGPYLEDEVRARFIPGPSGRSSWDFDIYLRPHCRIGLAFARLWDEANSFLRERGIRWTISRISVLNRASLAAHGRLGARRIGTAMFIRLAAAQLSISSIRPHIYFSFGRTSVPDFVLWPYLERTEIK